MYSNPSHKYKFEVFFIFQMEMYFLLSTFIWQL